LSNEGRESFLSLYENFHRWFQLLLPPRHGYFVEFAFITSPAEYTKKIKVEEVKK
jgi:hypothetical protein